MARGNFSNCLSIVLRHEGGYVDHPRDPGGATNLGVTHGTLAAHWGRPVTKQDVRDLTQADVEPIYRKGYWRPVKGDDLPAGVDLAVFDFGVNSGPSRSAKYLQGVVGVTRDGKIGPATLGAVRAADGRSVVQKLCARRLSFKRGLSHWSTFGRGWSRRVADIEARGVAMWMARLTPSVKAEALRAEAAAAGRVSSRQQAIAGGGAVGAGGGPIAADGEPLIMGVVAAAVVLVAVVLMLKSRQNKDRAEAYEQVAREME